MSTSACSLSDASSDERRTCRRWRLGGLGAIIAAVDNGLVTGLAAAVGDGRGTTPEKLEKDGKLVDMVG